MGSRDESGSPYEPQVRLDGYCGSFFHPCQGCFKAISDEPSRESLIYMGGTPSRYCRLIVLGDSYMGSTGDRSAGIWRYKTVSKLVIGR